MRTAALPEKLAASADDTRTTVAFNLDAMLKADRWSRRAAATALGLSHRYVNDRAAGDVDLSASDLAMFAEFLNVKVGDFFQPIPDDSNPRTLVPKVGGSNPSGGTIINFPSRKLTADERPTLAPVTPIRGAVA